MVDTHPRDAVAYGLPSHDPSWREFPSQDLLAHAMLARTAERHPAAPAIDFLGRRWCWREIAGMVDRVAAGLQARGVGKGDRVGLCLPNSPYFVVAYFGALKAGAVVVNFNPLYVARELEQQMRDAGVSVIFAIDIAEIYSKVSVAAARSGVRRVICCRLDEILPARKRVLYRVAKRKLRASLPRCEEHLAWADLMRTASSLEPVGIQPDDVALLQYTGGTTGTPKGAILTHANIVTNALQVAALRPARGGSADKVLGVLPLFHVFAMTVVMNWAVVVAAEMILLPRYDLDAVIASLVRHRPTSFPAVPTIYGAIARTAEAKRVDLSFIESCFSGGAPLPSEVGTAFTRLTGAPLVEGYGLTEASPVVTCNPFDGSGKAGSIGRPLADTIVEIRDPVTRELLPVGEKGELVIRGPQVMRGYWNKPDETSAVLDAHGLRTGDIGYKDADGFVFIVDRIKDVILSGGFNVYPRMIEDALYQHPDVREAIVIGIPDPYRGQAAKAFVVLRESSQATQAELGRFLEDHLSKIERPKVIEIRAQLPKTAIGKPSRKDLVAEELAARERASAA